MLKGIQVRCFHTSLYKSQISFHASVSCELASSYYFVTKLLNAMQLQLHSSLKSTTHKRIHFLLGATKTKKSNKVWCKLYFPEEPPVLIPGGITIIRENWNLKYSACFVLCSVPTNPLRVPESVSIVSEGVNATNQLPVLNADSGGTGTYEVNSTGNTYYLAFL